MRIVGREARMVTYFLKKWMICILLLFLINRVAYCEASNPNLQKNVSQSEGSTQGLTSPEDFETFLEPHIGEEMQKWHTPGLVFVLVKGGKIFFAKGYGYANLEKKIPVVPDKTLFRIGSVSKLVTATSVMQLAEKQLLNLNEDINQYLTRFQIKNKFFTPVTASHLLTHTGGFIDDTMGLFSYRKDGALPLETFLKSRMPPCALPPGDFIVYSSFGISLLGYIVQVRSGMDFEEYAQKNIFKPLEMHKTSFVLSDNLKKDLAAGYDYKNTTYYPLPFDYLNIYPAGSITSTGTDMASFMIAHLQNGRYKNVRILQEATAKNMHQQHATHHPRFKGVGYGFWESEVNSRRVIWHNGGVRGFGSWLYLIPKENMGLFMSYSNFNPSMDSGDVILKKVFDHYYPQKAEKTSLTLKAPIATNELQVRPFVGEYRWLKTGAPWHTWEKIFNLLGVFHVIAEKDGALQIYRPNAQEPSSFIEVKPSFFQNKEDPRRYLNFRKDSKENITSMVSEGSAGIKLPWYEKQTLHFVLIIIFLAVFSSGCIVWPLAYLVRRMRKKILSFSKASSRARKIEWAGSMANVLFLVGFPFLMVTNVIPGANGIVEYIYGMPPEIQVVLFIPWVIFILTVLTSVYTILVWKEGTGHLVARVYYSVVAVVMIAFLPFLMYWKLLF